MASWWNLLLGLFGLLIVFLLSFSANNVMTTVIRSITAFIIFFFSGYVFRWMIAYIRKDQTEPPLMLNEEELQSLTKELTEDEAKKIADYIRHITNHPNDGKNQ
ncbi:hypothetical protein [Thermaerobacillus caldiproteolyticus]|uniref:Putative membrane protein n=1 Tax=Thermaerobacillus caldiproteolyticus TaxID=247480 RepID=A0A7W0BXF5_9BACL|nr:hypothetical protein [Anoxybacillus caldiproteolyticus]MBA2873968.1 putative membrane protein [Anoxybacillus caldiproteolyticus]QPA32074.1 hypothetical protein ISX45_03495 [Anoxybacillus caldiproteolyticus]